MKLSDNFIKTVSCPQCGTPTEFSSKNPSRPFCSERCKLLDLGDWASEKYKVPLRENGSNATLDEESYEDAPNMGTDSDNYSDSESDN